jgi:hypothetical protein
MFVFFGSATPCASPPHRPSIFPIILFASTTLLTEHVNICVFDPGIGFVRNLRSNLTHKIDHRGRGRSETARTWPRRRPRGATRRTFPARPASRDRFYKTPFRPKCFRTYFILKVWPNFRSKITDVCKTSMENNLAF